MAFDGFGRLTKERFRMADGSWSRRVTQYNALGWKVFASEQGPDENGLPGTRYQLFDAFGRPTRIRPPDYDASPNHEISLSYNGVRLVSRTVRVATTTTSEEPVTTTETYDAHGRLIRVQGPARSDGQTVTTTYEYDVGNRLKKVRQDNGRAGAANRVQQRTFVYDNRGFLLEETHPEKGGPVKYGDYDPRGHAWTKEDGIATRKLWFGFDPAERLTEVREDNPGGQLLKKFTYDGSGRGLGKLATAARCNVAGAPFNMTAIVTESYSYQGVEGRISQKTTRNTVNGIDYELFTQSQNYDRAGNVLTITYLTCSNGGCGAGPVPSTARVLSFGYTNGSLTDIPGFTGVHTAPSPAVGILYHSNGMVASAFHANGVRDSVTVDSTSWLRRPKRLETVGAVASQNFVAGDYAYDASGNIKAIGADLFKYDKVSRLTEGTVRQPTWVSTVARTQGYSFDDFGNITAVTSTNARNTPTSDFTNRLTGIGTSYDEAGNLIAHNGTSYQFDRLNMLKRMTTAAGAAQGDWIYVYTADDERFWSLRVGGGGSLWSLRDLDGKVIRQFEAHSGWPNTKDYVHRQGQLFATVLPTGATQHYHLDHLGTSRLVTDAGKNASANFTYFPFGEEAAGGTVSAERMRFTGHKRDLNNAGGAGVVGAGAAAVTPRKQRRRPRPLILALVMAGCGLQSPPPAELVLTGGRVYTGDAAGSSAAALAVRDGRIVFVGDAAGARALVGAATEVVELEGRMVLPGFHDSHVHLVSGGVELGLCDLNGAGSAAEVAERIRAYAAAHPEREWIVGGGWDLPLYPGANPRREALDVLVVERPAYLTAADGHSVWVNSRALALAGITAATPDPPQGRIERDPATGEPAGTLREAASDLVAKLLPETSAADRLAGLRRALALAHGLGITSVIEASASEEILRAYAELDRRGELEMRVLASLYVDSLRGEEQVPELAARRASVAGGRRLRANSVKMFADGVIEAGTAALLAPYLNRPGQSGELNFEPAAFAQLATRLDREGFQIHIHAIGDRAIRTALDALAAARLANGLRDARHHLAHIQLFDPTDLPRFRELSVVANFQPLWAYADPYIRDLTEPVLGPERSRWLYPIASMVKSGATVAAGSDWSVSSLNPLAAIEVALARRDPAAGPGEAWIPEERTDLATMLAAYTRNGAYLAFQENETGTLEAGKAADLILLDRDLFAIPPHEISEVKVLRTWVAGREVGRGPG